jgi:hypothetical protein
MAEFLSFDWCRLYVILPLPSGTDSDQRGNMLHVIIIGVMQGVLYGSKYLSLKGISSLQELYCSQHIDAQQVVSKQQDDNEVCEQRIQQQLVPQLQDDSKVAKWLNGEDMYKQHACYL